jgi:uncharacterized C2H2 Zn-finger protein
MNNDKLHQGEEPVMCSKCNMVFESDADYKRHYDDNHRPEEQMKNNQ